MEDITVTGIVLHSMPYREKDKLINIFSVELGKITAILKGVNSPKSKLKFAGQPFCFGKFELAGNGDIMTVKGVELIDSFFDLTLDYDKYSLASAMLEISSAILRPNIIMDDMFISLIKTLQYVVYSGVDYRLSILKFFLSVLDYIGYSLNFHTCDNCGMKFVGDIKFSFDTGTFRCAGCSGGYKIEKKDFMTLKIVSSTEISRLHTIKISNDSIICSIRLVVQDIVHRLSIRLKSIDINNI